MAKITTSLFIISDAIFMSQKKIEQYNSVEGEDLNTFINNNFQDRSETAQEIINRKPDFIEKWALFFFLGILLVLTAGSMCISYPYIVKTRAALIEIPNANKIVHSHEMYYAQMLIPQKELGRIEKGMKVQLHLDAYPYHEYGFLRGKISNIADSITNDGCMVSIRLDSGLLTDQKKLISFKHGMQADAVIITKHARLFQRLYYNLR